MLGGDKEGKGLPALDTYDIDKVVACQKVIRKYLSCKRGVVGVGMHHTSLSRARALSLSIFALSFSHSRAHSPSLSLFRSFLTTQYSYRHCKEQKPTYQYREEPIQKIARVVLTATPIHKIFGGTYYGTAYFLFIKIICCFSYFFFTLEFLLSFPTLRYRA